MDADFFIGRILETENLTDNLEDADAKKLLNWGIQHVGALIGDPSSAHDNVNALMGLLRQINRIAPDAASKDPQALAADLAALAEAAERTLGVSPPRDGEALHNLAVSLAAMPPAQAIDTLIQWLGTAPQGAD